MLRWAAAASQGRGSGGGELGEGWGWPGWPTRGGWWGERLPARSPTLGVVEGGGET